MSFGDISISSGYSYLLTTSSGPTGKKYKIGPGLAYDNGSISCACDVGEQGETIQLFIIDQVPGSVLPANQCGVHIQGFSKGDFGKWSISAKASNKKKTTRSFNIETLLVPCSSVNTGLGVSSINF